MIQDQLGALGLTVFGAVVPTGYVGVAETVGVDGVELGIGFGVAGLAIALGLNAFAFNMGALREERKRVPRVARRMAILLYSYNAVIVLHAVGVIGTALYLSSKT